MGEATLRDVPRESGEVRKAGGRIQARISRTAAASAAISASVV